MVKTKKPQLPTLSIQVAYLNNFTSGTELGKKGKITRPLDNVKVTSFDPDSVKMEMPGKSCQIKHQVVFHLLISGAIKDSLEFSGKVLDVEPLDDGNDSVEVKILQGNMGRWNEVLGTLGDIQREINSILQQMKS